MVYLAYDYDSRLEDRARWNRVTVRYADGTYRDVRKNRVSGYNEWVEAGVLGNTEAARRREFHMLVDCLTRRT